MHPELNRRQIFLRVYRGFIFSVTLKLTGCGQSTKETREEVRGGEASENATIFEPKTQRENGEEEQNKDAPYESPEELEPQEDEDISVETVEMWDMHAISLYYDGTYGPETGIISVDDIVSNQAKTINFWHGHGGVQHQYTVTPEHYKRLKNGERIIIETSSVENHAHTLFIDPTDEMYRVEGSEIREIEKA